MIENRPDWVVSRQRAWGVPLSIFYNKKTGAPLVNGELNKKLLSVLKKKDLTLGLNTLKKSGSMGSRILKNMKKLMIFLMFGLTPVVHMLLY